MTPKTLVSKFQPADDTCFVACVCGGAIMHVYLCFILCFSKGIEGIKH